MADYEMIPRTALVTGASRGIGRAIAEALAQEGWNLFLTCSYSMSELTALAKELETGYGICAESFLCDMGDSASVSRLFEKIPSLTLLVNNAGIAHIGLLQDMTDEEWDRILSVNLSSVFYTSRAAIPLFLKNRRAGEGVPGRILNISSVWGNVGASCEAAYSATKGGVNSLTRALAKELAPSGIPVNAIACGCVDTRMNAQLSAEEKAELSEEIPAGRFAQPSEIARAVLSLIHTPAYLTGQIVTMDGGWI